MNDAEISAAATLQPISDIAATVNINDEALIPYGHHMAKVDTEKVQTSGKRGKLVLVTAVSPTPAGEGKSTVSVGIAEEIGRASCREKERALQGEQERDENTAEPPNKRRVSE